MYLFGKITVKPQLPDRISELSTIANNLWWSWNSYALRLYDYIDSSVDLGSNVGIYDEDEAWLSKLTLDYYLSLLGYDKNDPTAYEKVVSQTLLYDEINPADIEGGGRVIVALKDDKFEIPEDADGGFVYIGLDKNFEVVTDYIIK